MGENHRTVSLALIKICIFVHFNTNIFIYINIDYAIKLLLQFLIL